MPRLARLSVHVVALLCFSAISAFFWWPLPLRLADTLPGPPEGDTGVYVWNLWVFRHEIIAHHAFPFFTSEILNPRETSHVPLVRHNYTTVANLLAFPLIGWIGLVPTFNIFVLATNATSAYAMFLFARARTGDMAAAFVGGLLYGFSPYMLVRGSEHFSLAQSAALPIFGLLMLKLVRGPRSSLAILSGLTVAWAYLSDPYYGVYCLLIGCFTLAYLALDVDRGAPKPGWWRWPLDVGLLCLGGLIAAVMLRGGGQVEFGGLRFSVRHLYTPVLLFSVFGAVRLWTALSPQLRWRRPFGVAHARAGMLAVTVCTIALGPVLVAMADASTGRIWESPTVWWRSSAPGVDMAAWIAPNPLNPWIGSRSAAWLSTLPNGSVENVASMSWIAVATIAIVWVCTGFAGSRGWWAFMGLFGWLSLGPFIRVAAVNTYIPTPWAVLRYLPVVGAARMPTRMTVLVVMALSMLLAMALAAARRGRARRLWIPTLCATMLLLELFPGQRQVFSAVAPKIFHQIQADPRDVRVLTLPFGIKDGINSRGGFSTAYQYYQTVHEKPLIGGYISRLPPGTLTTAQKSSVARVLFRLSENGPVPVSLYEAGISGGPEFVVRTRLGYVVADLAHASAALIQFAERALALEFVDESEGFRLYRTAGR